MTDGRTRTEAIAISPTLFLKKRGDKDLFSLYLGQRCEFPSHHANR